jgi:hypothetical protein
MCAARREIVAAQVANHIEDHKGDINSFLMGSLQSLCWSCHSSKPGIEHRGFDTSIGLDGYPRDERHPVYSREKRR